MVRRLFCFFLAFWIFTSTIYADTRPGQDTGAETDLLPDIAKPSIGFRSVTSDANSDYKQPTDNFVKDANMYMTDFQKEIFPVDQKSHDYTGLIRKIAVDDANIAKQKSGEIPRQNQEGMPEGRTFMGNPILDDYTPDDYAGLSDDEIKWLVNNNVITRDIPDFRANGQVMTYTPPGALIDFNVTQKYSRSRFLMDLYKAKWGPIESRPITYSIQAYRKAQQVKYTWQEEQWTLIPPTTDMDSYWKMILPDAWIQSFDILKDQLVTFSDAQVQTALNQAEGQPNGYTFSRGEYYVQDPLTNEYRITRYSGVDKVMYVTPNVVELYLKALLDKGIINDQNLRIEYKEKARSNNVLKIASGEALDGFDSILTTYGKTVGVNTVDFPVYAPELGPLDLAVGLNNCYPLNVNLIGSNNSEDALGKRYTVQSDGVICKDTDWNNIDYFYNENLSTMEALRFIEAVLRQTERDMTNEEAKIITYKYGATYLGGLTSRDQQTLMYLIAMGVIDFESPEELSMIYYQLTTKLALTLLYRVANPAARKDFSKIQLTDSDNFWMTKGYGALDQTIYQSNDDVLQTLEGPDGTLLFNPVPDVPTVQVVETDAQDKPVAPASMTTGLINSPYASPFGALSNPVQDVRTKWYIVTKDFDTLFKYTWRSDDTVKDFTKLVFTDDSFLDPFVNNIPGLNDEIKKQFINGSNPRRSINLGSSSSNDGSLTVYYDADRNRYTADFRVQAPTSDMAIYFVDKNIGLKVNTGTEDNPVYSKSACNSVTKVSEDGGAQIILVPASAFSGANSEIRAMADKSLYNVKTQTKAIIVKENETANLALVGAEIIKGDDLLVTVNGVDYYNFEIIKALSDNVYPSDLDKADVYLCNNIGRDWPTTIKNTQGNILPNKAYVAEITYSTYDPDASGKLVPNVTNKTAKFVKLNSLSYGDNILVQKYSLKFSDTQNVNYAMIVEWNLVLPNAVANMPGVEKLIPDNESLKMSDIPAFYYTRPDNAELADWWDNNIAISNAITKFLYSSTYTDMQKCGYLVPSIKVLYDDLRGTDGVESAVRKDLAQKFAVMGTYLPSGWISRFLGPDNNYNSISQGQDMFPSNADNKYFPWKSVPSNYFPSWIHVMFNNWAGYDDTPGLGTQIHGDGYGDISEGAVRFNGTLWRDKQMMGQRTMSFNRVRCPDNIAGGFYSVYHDIDLKKMNMPSVDYILTKNGDIYRETSEGSGLVSVTTSDGNRITDILQMENTANDVDNSSNFLRNVVTWKGNQLYFNRVDGQYMEFISLDPIEGVSDSAGGMKYMLNNDPNNVVDVSTYAQGILNDKFKDNDGKLRGVDEKTIVPNQLPLKYYEVGKYYLICDVKANGDISQLVKVYNGDTGLDSPMSLQAKTAMIYYPTIRLNFAYWRVDSNKNIVRRDTSAIFLTNNIFDAGVNTSVIDSVIATSSGQTIIDVNKLTNGSVITIGDLIFVKDGDKFVSAPVKYISNSDRIETNVDSQQMQVILTTNLLKLLQIAVDLHGRTSTVSAYVKQGSVTLGPFEDIDNFGCTETGTLISVPQQDSTQLVPYLKQGNKDAILVNSGTEKSDSVVYSVAFEDGLIAVPINEADRTYRLLSSVTASGSNVYGNMPYYADGLLNHSYDDLAIKLNKNAFETRVDADYIRQVDTEDYKKLQADAFRHNVSIILVVVGAFVMIMTWIVYWLLQLPVFRYWCGMIKYPEGNIRFTSGLDIPKILTFGVMGLDNEVALNNVIKLFLLEALATTIIQVFIYKG